MNPALLLTEWSRLLFDSLANAGVTDVVVSPGSRSTPFVFAAALESRLRCHTIIDERSASFFALGQARRTGRPSVLLCTSGTAAAHYLPAVIEAATAFVPLIVLTADRPLELQDCNAPQTIDQTKMFGGFARHFFDTGTPEDSVASLRALRRIAAQAVHLARSPLPGAVHINARARKPLEPVLEPQPVEARGAFARIGSTPFPRPAAPCETVDAHAIAHLARVCAEHGRGIIACGAGPASQAALREAIERLATATGYPVFADAASQLRFGSSRDEGGVYCDGYDALLSSTAFRRRHRPELVLQIGAPPTTSAWERYLDEAPDAKRFVLTPHGWNDPSSSAAGLLYGPLESSVAALAEAVESNRVTASADRDSWRQGIAAADDVARAILCQELADRPGLSEGAVARAVVAALPDDSVLVVGNSLSIRHVDRFAVRSSRRVAVLSQRGANGIDGLVAGAFGAASVDAPTATTLLIGDVSFLHDVSSLILGRAVRSPVVIVVVNNDGGRIFEQLPLGSVPDVDRILPHFTTPHGLRFEHAARLYGHRYAEVRDAGALSGAMAAAYAAGGCTVIEATVPPSDAVAQQRRVAAALDRSLPS